uniref:Protein YIPF5-like n=1 Tax=Ciona intestinalis TaxID=7719 RepID=A0A1W3JGQ0_CIOIN|nr:protein YIPF5-like [Ciona intestinalis]|eukprot:XP_009860868.1 protein YIPF5-like [Ciona intestinalis]
MATFQGNDGFYQSNYNNANQDPNYGQQQQGYGGYYDNQGGYNQGGYSGGYPQQPQQPMMMNPTYNNAYSGDIMQPQEPVMGSMPPDSYSGGFEDEPPLLEELGINFDHIYQKTLAVLNPFTITDAGIIKETDLAGPLCFCLALGATLLLGGKVSFGYIYGIGGLGVVAIYALLSIMSMNGVTVGSVASVIGYCILPMVFLSGCSLVISLKGVVGIILTLLTVTWCSLSASKLFVCGFDMESQQLLVAYPCALLYGVFALLTVF